MEHFLPSLFSKVLNMSITASYVILFVMIARLLLKKTPKIFSYTLWSVVLFRLLCPFSFSSAFSFLKAITPSSGKMDYIPSNVGMMVQPQIETGIDKVNSIVNSSLPVAMPYASANPMQIILFILSVIWALGVLALVIYSVSSYFLLKQKVSTAMLFKDNIFECDNITTPFVLGIIKPKIYLPIGLAETEKSFILRHEQTHIKRLDYLIKPFAFLVFCVHWFNPLAWLSFVLMSRDMEMSCDEQVIKELGSDIKKAYSTSLLSLAVNRRMISGSALSFGETGVKGRIKNVLNYQRPALWVIVAGVIVVAAMVVGLSSNPNAAIADNDVEKTQLAGIWAEALRTRDGKPRYEIMSESMKAKFIAEQKHRAGEEWNYNIGYSSPWVVEYEIDVQGNTASIIYHLTDSTSEKYDWTEIITFGKENNRLVIIDALQVEKVISIDDLTERSIITSDRYKNTEYPLIAELPKEDIYLYGLKPTGVVLKYGDKIQLFNWEHTTPRFIMPVLNKSDLDHDGKDEIICVLDAGSGTGVSLYELHVLKSAGTSGYVDYMFSDYLEQMKTMFSATYDQKENSIVLKTNNSSYTYDIPTEFQRLTYKNIAYGNIVYFDISHGMKIKMPLGVLFDEFASPQFFEDTAFFEGDIVIKNGKFQITRPRITNM
jgi:beta-lactamase regulating signal transducer with metallopeptidase domain